MGYHIEFNCLLVVSPDQLDLGELKKGDVRTIVKDEERLYPLNIPIEVCNQDYRYFGKVAVRKLSLVKGSTTLQIEILKIFDESEAEVYTKNFIRPYEL